LYYTALDHPNPAGLFHHNEPSGTVPGVGKVYRVGETADHRGYGNGNPDLGLGLPVGKLAAEQ
jgi:hypothetical protein